MCHGDAKARGSNKQSKAALALFALLLVNITSEVSNVRIDEMMMMMMMMMMMTMHYHFFSPSPAFSGSRVSATSLITSQQSMYQDVMMPAVMLFSSPYAIPVRPQTSTAKAALHVVVVVMHCIIISRMVPACRLHSMVSGTGDSLFPDVAAIWFHWYPSIHHHYHC